MINLGVGLLCAAAAVKRASEECDGWAAVMALLAVINLALGIGRLLAL